MASAIPQNIPDYEDPEFIIHEDAEASMEVNIIRGMLPPLSEWTVDLGCGYGRLSGIMAERTRNLILLDYSMAGIIRAQKRMLDADKDAFFILADIHHLPFRSCSVDTIVMFRVFHHFPDPDAAIDEIARCLKHAGHLIFNYNSSDNASMILFWLMGRIKGENAQYRFPFPLSGNSIRATEESHKRPIYFQTHSTVRNIMQKNNLTFSGLSFHSGMLGKGLVKKSKLHRAIPDFQTRIADKWVSRFLFPNHYVSCTKDGPEDHAAYHEIDDLLVCPMCHESVSINGNLIICNNGHRFSMVNGIYDFRKEC